MKNISKCAWQIWFYSVKYNYQMKKGGNADGGKNRRAEKSGISTHSAHVRNWNSHSRYKNGYWEYPVIKGEGNLSNARGGFPPLCKYNKFRLQKQYDKRNIYISIINYMVNYYCSWFIFDSLIDCRACKKVSV